MAVQFICCNAVDSCKYTKSILEIYLKDNELSAKKTKNRKSYML